MINSFRVRNFKAFQDTGIIPLKPLTVIAGPNSGGKSTILQSLLLLKQTLEGQTDIDLNLDGKYLQFSAFDELTFGKPPLPRCEISFAFDVELPIPSSAIPRFFSGLSPTSDADFEDLQSSVDLKFRHRKWEGGNKVVLDRFSISSHLANVQGPQISGRFLNGDYQVKLRGKGVQPREPFKDRAIKTVAGVHFLPHALVFEEDEDSHNHPIPLPLIFLSTIGMLEMEIAHNLQYLGPSRERPRRAYLHSGNPMTEIGESGEYAAQVLWLEQGRKIQYLKHIGESAKEVTILEAVNEALETLGVSQPVSVRSEKGIVYQTLFGLRAAKKDDAVTIADVGFGLSQLLPIVMLGLRSDDRALLMFEQPEIHLHPRLQANLADFFLTLVEQGRRVMVETHSDHFINRLRRRIAEDQTDTLRDKVNILFVNPPHEGQGAKIDPLRVDRYGVVENWPADFLPEAADEAEAIFSAGLSKRGV